MTGRVHCVLSRVVDVRAHEIRALALGFACFFCLLSGYYLLRPLRDALGLAGGVGRLPWLFTATFVVMLAAVPVYGRIAARRPPRRFAPAVQRFFAVNALVFAALFATGWRPAWVAPVFFVWTSVFNLFVVSVFWSVMVDLFREEQGRRLFGFVAAGGTAGALAGPALAGGLVPLAGPAGLAAGAALLLEAAARCITGLQRGRNAPAASGHTGAVDTVPVKRIGSTDSNPPGRPTPTSADPRADRALGGGAWAGLVHIARSRYLLGITAFVLLLTMTATFLYFEQGRIVAESFPDTVSRTRFFALTDLTVSLLTLGVQLLGTATLIRRFGLGSALCALPVVTALAGVALLASPVPAILVAVQALRRTADYALARPARELLFTVVPREDKYKAKGAIETVVYRGGDAASGWLSAALSAAGPAWPMLALLPAGALWVTLGAWLARRQAERAAGTEFVDAGHPSADGGRG